MKYYNQKIIIDGHEFDSKKEGKRYSELKLLERAGCIKDLELQPAFLLIPSFKKNGKTYRKMTYIADFKYYDVNQQKTIGEDTKGYRTEVYKIKKKLFEYKYPSGVLKIFIIYLIKFVRGFGSSLTVKPFLAPSSRHCKKNAMLCANCLIVPNPSSS